MPQVNLFFNTVKRVASHGQLNLNGNATLTVAIVK